MKATQLAARAPCAAPERDSPFLSDLEGRLARLDAALAAARRRLVLSDSVLRGVREELRGLSGRLARLEEGAAGCAGVLLVPAPGGPAPAAVGRLAPAAPRRRTRAWLQFAPPAALLALAAALGARGGPVPPQPLLPRPVVAPSPVPAPAASEMPGEEEQSRDAALGLVLDFRPAPGKPTVAELLAPEIEASSEAHPWVLERTGPASFLVAFRPYGEVLGYQTPIYEFEVDLAAARVKPSPETLRSLGGGPPLAAAP